MTDPHPPGSSERPRVYLVHRTADKPKVRVLADALRQRYGVDVWFDEWEILGGDNVIAKMEQGIASADGGLVFVGKEGLGDRWALEEYEALLGRVVAGQSSFLIPVLDERSDASELPPFLAARKWLSHEDVEGIARAIYGRVGLEVSDKPGPWLAPEPVRIELELRRENEELVVEWGELRGRTTLVVAAGEALRGLRRSGARARDSSPVEAASRRLQQLGEALGEVFQTGKDGLGEALVDRLGEARGEVVITMRSNDTELLALPWEAALLPAPVARPLALVHDSTLARIIDAPICDPRPIDGPLRILIAVASPRDDLDLEHEHEQILAGLEHARLSRPRVVFIDECPTYEAIRRQLQAEPFHVVHLSAHGGAGMLALEDADGEAVGISGETLAQLLVQSRHPPQVVVLSACWSAARVETGELDHLGVAQTLIEAGVPQVIAMQGPVGDGYAGELAGHLYGELAADNHQHVARALARARRAVEDERLARARQGQRYVADVPEYATPVSFARSDTLDRSLFDTTRPWDPPEEPRELIPVRGMVTRPVGWMVGRRAMRRRVRELLVARGRAGVLLLGMGGSGKSTLATAVCRELIGERWGVVTLVGRFAAVDLAREAAAQLRRQSFAGQVTDRGRRSLDELDAHVRTLAAGEPVPERELLAPIQQIWLEQRVVLLLDNFEDNLSIEGGRLPAELERRDASVSALTLPRELEMLFDELLPSARVGAVLITCRYDLRERHGLEPVHVGPVTAVAMRRLLWRLPGLLSLEDRVRDEALEALGGHPRVLEFADALLRARPGRLDVEFGDIRERIEALAARLDEELPHELDEASSQSERIEQARRLAAEDVLLTAVLDTLDEPTRRFLDAAAVYRRGVPGDAFDAVAGAVGLEWTQKQRRRAVRALVRVGLMAETGPGARMERGEWRSWARSWVVYRWIVGALREHVRVGA